MVQRREKKQKQQDVSTRIAQVSQFIVQCRLKIIKIICNIILLGAHILNICRYESRLLKDDAMVIECNEQRKKKL